MYEQTTKFVPVTESARKPLIVLMPPFSRAFIRSMNAWIESEDTGRQRQTRVLTANSLRSHPSISPPASRTLRDRTLSLKAMLKF